MSIEIERIINKSHEIFSLNRDTKIKLINVFGSGDLTIRDAIIFHNNDAGNKLLNDNDLIRIFELLSGINSSKVKNVFTISIITKNKIVYKVDL